MATTVKITTKGFDEYLEKVKAAGNDVDAAADAALKRAGEIVVAAIRSEAPVLTGKLKNEDISMQGPTQDGNYHFVEVGVISESGEVMRKAIANEYGTSSMAAQPFIKPGADKSKNAARKAMRDELEQRGML